MAGLALGVAGAAIGSVFGPLGSQIGWSLGSMAGNYFFSPTQKQEGPRLNSFNIQTNTNGIPITKGWGTFRTAGNLIWFGGFKEHKKVETQRQGGKGGPKVENTTYTYTASFALAIHESEISGIRRIWANKNVVYNYSANNNKTTGNIAPYMRIYTGTDTQSVDSLIQQDKGEYTPAFRGLAYVVFENLPLGDFNNQLPQLEFEIVNKIGQLDNDQLFAKRIGQSHNNWFVDPYGNNAISNIIEHPITKYLYSLSGSAVGGSRGGGGSSEVVVSKINPKTMSVIDSSFFPNYLGNFVGFNSDGDLVFVSGGTNQQFLSFNILDKDSLIITTVDAYDENLNLKPMFSSLGGIMFDYLFGYVQSTDIMISEVQSGFLKYDITATSFNSTYYPYNDYYSVYSFDINPNQERVYFLTVEDFYTFKLNYLDGYGQYHYNVIELTNNDVYDSATLFVNENLGFAYVVLSGYQQQPIIVKKINLLTMEVDTEIFDFTDYSYSTDFVADHNYGFSKSKNKLYFTVSSANLEQSFIESINLYSLTEKRTLIDPTEFASFYQYSSYIGLYSEGWDGYIVPTIESFNTSPDQDTLACILFAENRFKQEDYMLGDLIKSVCYDIGLLDDKLDTTELDLIPVRGFKRDRQMTARQIFEMLSIYYNFDAVESNGILKFVLRGKEAVATIDDTELGASFYSAGNVDINRFNTQRIQEADLPKNLNVVFYDPLKDYEQNTQQAQRIINTSNNTETVEAPIVFTSTEAKQLAERLIYQAYITRDKYQFQTNYNYIDIEPCDVVNITRNGQQYTVRITKKDESQGIIRFEAEAEQQTVYIQDGVGDTGNTSADEILDPAQTFIFILDIPIFDIKDNDIGDYAVVNSSTDGTWRGADIFKSSTKNGEYLSQASFTEKTITGKVITCFNNIHLLNTIDYLTTIDINTTGQLYSITREELLNGGNLCLIGNELLQFMNAELIGVDTYRLSGLLRGRFGTERYISELSLNKRFIYFNFTNNSILRINKNDYMFNVDKYYKGVSVGQSTDDVFASKFKNTAVGLKPYSVVNVLGSRNANKDLIVEFKKRIRGQAVLNNTYDPVDPDGDFYEIDIYDNDSIVRTISTTDLSFTYTAAQQIQDFGLEQNNIKFSIYKINRNIGRGFDQTLTL